MSFVVGSLQFQHNTGESCSSITPILGTISCKHTAKSTLHQLPILCQSAQGESTTGTSQC